MDGVAIALVSCMLMATEAVFTKILTSHFTPLSLAAMTSFTATIIVIFLLEIKHKACEVTSLTRHDALMMLTIGLLSGVLAQVLYVSGVLYSTATNAVLLTRLNSLLIAVMGVVFLKEKFTKHHIVGSIFMVLGVLLIITKNFTEIFTPQPGDIFLLGTAICWASSNIVMKKHLTKIPPEVLVLGRHVVAAVTLTFFVFIAGTRPIESEGVAYFTGYVIITVLIGQYLWYKALEHTTASNVALTSLTIPLLGVLYANVFLGETLFDYQILGGVSIFIGLAVIEIHMSTLKKIEHRLKSIHFLHH
ncbi:MAG: DMT family transporter [Candidatus Altiarchaeota archaeon]|nr:DMT family transporter [Candidatus Altiarchaeota archaeon]